MHVLMRAFYAPLMIMTSSIRHYSHLFSPFTSRNLSLSQTEEKRRYFSRSASKYNAGKYDHTAASLVCCINQWRACRVVEVFRNESGQFGFGISGGLEEDTMPSLQIGHVPIKCSERKSMLQNRCNGYGSNVSSR